MNQVKRYFAMPYLGVALSVCVYAGVKLYRDGMSASWLGALIAVGAPAGFLLSLGVWQRARTSRNLWGVLLLSTAGAVYACTAFQSPASWLAVVLGPVWAFLYVFWYSPMDRSASADVLRIGNKLPALALRNAQGERVAPAEGRGGLYMFVRGNWCPLCMTQIQEVADKYRELEARGVDLFVVTPQPERATQKLAKKFAVPIQFCVDADNQVAKQLGIEHPGGVPVGIPGFGTDAVLPTVIITDAARTILFADQTDNYRVRPEPQTFLAVLDMNA